MNGMPIEYKCRKCGYILFKSTDTVLPVNTVISRYSKRCPKCGKVLSFNVFEDVKIEAGSRRRRRVL